MAFYTHEVVFLDITSWVGTIACGEHWYGRLKWQDKDDEDERHDHELEWKLDTECARRLTEDDKVRMGSLGYTYRKGQWSNRFFSREKLVERAIEEWKKQVPDGKVLLIGSPSNLSPMEIIAGPRKLMRLGNQVWQKWERSEFNDKLCIKLEDQWEKLFKKAGFWD